MIMACGPGPEASGVSCLDSVSPGPGADDELTSGAAAAISVCMPDGPPFSALQGSHRVPLASARHGGLILPRGPFVPGVASRRRCPRCPQAVDQAIALRRLACR
jgi:hypothetical protein